MENNKSKKKMHKKVKDREHLQNTKITSERCKKIRKFLKRQCVQTGQDLGHLLGQSLSRCEVQRFLKAWTCMKTSHPINTTLQVAQIVQHQCEHKTLDNNVPVALLPTDPKVEIKVEAYDEESQIEKVKQAGTFIVR